MPQWYGPLNTPWPPKYNQSTAWPPSGVGPTYNQFGQKLIGGQVFDAPTGGMPGQPAGGAPTMPRPTSQPGQLSPGFPTKPMFSPGTTPAPQAAFTPGATSLGMGTGQGRGIPPFPTAFAPSSLPPSSMPSGAPRRTVFPGF